MRFVNLVYWFVERVQKSLELQAREASYRMLLAMFDGPFCLSSEDQNAKRHGQ